MSGLENMSQRIGYLGGKQQVKRMNEDKLKTLKKALLYSYQSATAQLSDGRQFRCLINSDKIKNEYDNKYISIPFYDICLNEKEISFQENNKIKKTSEGLQEIGLSAGQVFTWVENNTDWLVYLQRLEETAYFRAEIRRCKYEVEVNGIKYKCYVARKSIDNIDWRKVHNIMWTDIDYTLQMYITKDENTESMLHRYSILKINNKPWEVQAIDNISSDGIIILGLKEYFQNSIEEKVEEEKQEEEQYIDPIDENTPQIIGPKEVYPYDINKIYYIENAEGGAWDISSPKVKIINQDESSIKISILTGRSGEFNIKYIRENEEDVVLKVTIKSL